MNFDELNAAIEVLEELRQKLLLIEPTRQQEKMLNTAYSGLDRAENALRGFVASLMEEVTT